MASAIGDTRAHVLENRRQMVAGQTAISRGLEDVQREVGALRRQIARLSPSLTAAPYKAEEELQPPQPTASALPALGDQATVVAARGQAEAHDISELVAGAAASKAWLQAAREAIGNGIVWYQYDILGNIYQLDALLHGENRDLGLLAGGLPVADIGAADGDFAFTLEREWGWEVDIIETAATNQNGLEAARALRAHLRSGVQVHDIDLDAQFRLPRAHYGLVFFLGILYHLRNPFFVLQELARRADYCLLSTRVARFAGPEKTAIADLPVAYLVGARETNNDPTNYWMFSPDGLERLVDRAGWRVLERFSVGDVVRSDPASPDHDERMFMLMSSKVLSEPQ